MKKFVSLMLTLALMLSLGAFNFVAQAEEAEEAKEDFVEWNSGTEFTPDEDQTFLDFLGSEPTSLDPARASDNYAINIMTNIYEPLVLVHTGSNGDLEYIAGGASWEVSEDGTVYTFHLRDNQWWDGQPVTAQDYEYALKRAIDPATGAPYVYLLSDILNAVPEEAEEADGEEAEDAEEAEAPEFDMDAVGVKALDDKTLEITLKAPSATFLHVMSQSIAFPVRQDKIEEFGEAYGTETDKVMGNGPFTITEWTHNTKIVLEKNDTYWNAANVVYTTVEIPIMSDENTIMQSFMNREIFAAGATKPEWREKFEADPDVEKITMDNIATFFMMFNTQDELFSNAKVRRAFSAALDREDFNETIWFGNLKPATGWVPLTIYVGDQNYREAAGNQVDALHEQVPDPKALLDEALTEMGMEDKIDNLEVSIILGATDAWFRTFGEYLQSVFKEVLNVDLKVEQLDWTVFSDRVSKSDYQIGYMAWGSELIEPNAMLLIHADGSPQVGTYWNNEEYNKLVHKAQNTVDDAERLQLYIDAEKILMEESPVAPVVHSVTNTYRYDFLKNVDDLVWGNMGYRQGFISGK